jgi:hypothetical protein
MEDIRNLSSAEISNLIAEKEKELGIATNIYYDVEQEKLLLQRQILELQIKKKDFEVSLSKASQNLKKMQLELKALRNFFWNAKNSGT